MASPSSGDEDKIGRGFVDFVTQVPVGGFTHKALKSFASGFFALTQAP